LRLRLPRLNLNLPGLHIHLKTGYPQAGSRCSAKGASDISLPERNNAARPASQRALDVGGVGHTLIQLHLCNIRGARVIAVPALDDFVC
jgi:hypothetical protein